MKFEFMEDAANELCDELENNPNRFTETTHTLNDNRTGTQYWIGSSSRNAITEVWNRNSNDTVFSYQQGMRIRAAFEAMREYKANAAQEKILRSSRSHKNVTTVKFKEIGNKSWYERFCDWLKSGPRIDI